MYGDGWYEQFGRGGTNAAFYGGSAFGPAMGTYQPGQGAAIGGDYYTSARYAASVADNTPQRLKSLGFSVQSGQLGYYRPFGSVGYSAPGTLLNGRHIDLGEVGVGMRFTPIGSVVSTSNLLYVPNESNGTLNIGHDIPDTPYFGPGMWLSGQPFVHKYVAKLFIRSFAAKNAIKWTSPASIFFRKIIPSAWETVPWLPKAFSLGGQIGRVTPMIGMVLTIGQVLGTYWYPAARDNIRDYNETHPIDKPGNLIYHVR